MKSYKIKLSLFLLFPVIVSSVIIFYMVFMYKKSLLWVNIANIGFDVIILLHYLSKFCYKISKDKEHIYFYTFFKTYRLLLKEYEGAIYTSVFTKIKTRTKNFYILSVKKDRYILMDILDGINKR